MLQRNSTAKRKRSGDLDVEIKCYMIMQPNEKDEFFQSIKQLYQSESLCDVSFKIGDTLFPVHRVILAAANRYGAQRVTLAQKATLLNVSISWFYTGLLNASVLFFFFYFSIVSLGRCWCLECKKANQTLCILTVIQSYFASYWTIYMESVLKFRLHLLYPSLECPVATQWLAWETGLPIC